jgi:hypothetical protein
MTRLTMLFALFFATLPCLQAQRVRFPALENVTGLRLRGSVRSFSGTQVIVKNDSGSPLVVEAADPNKHRLQVIAMLSHGEAWTQTFGAGHFYLSRAFGRGYDYAQLGLVVQVCRDGFGRQTRFTVPPSWAADPAFIGDDLALTEEFLRSNPAEPVLKDRVRQIERRLDQEKFLGRGEKKSDIKHWYNEVRKHQISNAAPACLDPVAVPLRFTIHDPYYYSGRTRIFVIRADRRGGYRAEYR